MTYDENKDTATMCEVYKAEAEALRKALKSGDWSDKGEKIAVNTDRTQSTIELIDEIENLNNMLAVKNEYIATLEARIAELEK